MKSKAKAHTLDWLNHNLERNESNTGWYAYKVFGAFYRPRPDWNRPDWKQEPGETITVPHMNHYKTRQCGTGIHAATLDWMLQEFFDLNHFAGGDDTRPVWKVEILEADLDNIVVPWDQVGKFRCMKMRLVEIVTTVRLSHWPSFLQVQEIHHLAEVVRRRVAAQQIGGHSEAQGGA